MTLTASGYVIYLNIKLSFNYKNDSIYVIVIYYTEWWHETEVFPSEGYEWTHVEAVGGWTTGARYSQL